jgi:nucleotide-binding universal stress UspA family protein
MKIFEKILCPIDFSQNSVKALQWTEYLANKFQSEVMILHVMELYPVGIMTDVGIDYDRYYKTLNTNFDEFLAPIRIKYEKMISTGDPANKIAALASGLHASLVVMGTRGMLGTAHKLLGSTSESVMRTSSVPVFSVSPHCRLPRVTEEHNVLVPLSSLYRPPKRTIRFRKLIRELQCSPTFLHVIDYQDEMFNASFDANPFLVATHETKEKVAQLAKIGAMLHKNGSLAESHIQFGNVATEILKELETNKYDYLLLEAKKKNLLTRFVETNAYKVISQAAVPVITVTTD